MDIFKNEIHLWYAYDKSIQDADLLKRYCELLNDQELSKQKRFHFEKHRHQYLITRAMVRSILSLYVSEIAPEKWEFKNNDYGKPLINNESLPVPLGFNISHCDGLIVMAVALEQKIGVDVEYLPRLGKNLDLAKRFFSPTEVDHLFDLPPEKQKSRFFDLWTLKEAYIKACGMGLSIPLDHFSFHFFAQGKISISFTPERNDQPEYWQFWQVHPDDTHKVAVAIKSDSPENIYSISMRKIVPLSDITQENYANAAGHLISA